MKWHMQDLKKKTLAAILAVMLVAAGLVASNAVPIGTSLGDTILALIGKTPKNNSDKLAADRALRSYAALLTRLPESHPAAPSLIQQQALNSACESGSGVRISSAVGAYLADRGVVLPDQPEPARKLLCEQTAALLAVLGSNSEISPTLIAAATAYSADPCMEKANLLIEETENWISGKSNGVSPIN